MSKEDKFKRALNAGDVLGVAFGAMIGWSWVVASGQWIQAGGVFGTAIGFLIGGIMVFFVGHTYAELTTAMPKCGGEHVFSYKAFGGIGSFICTWAIILGYVGVVCFEVVSFPTIIQYIFPDFLKGYMYTVEGFDVYASWLALGIVLAIIIVVINIIGTKKAAVLQNIMTIIIASVGIMLAVASVFTGSISNLDGQLFNGTNIGSVIENTLKVAIMTPLFLFGFDVIPQAAEEIKVPLKKLGKLLVLSIMLVVFFYAIIVLSVGYVLNVDEIKISMETTGLVTADAMKKAFGSGAMANVLIIGGMCGLLTSWNSFLIGGSRAIYSMADSYMVPRIFAKLHPKYKTPVNALILIGILSVIAPLFGRVMLVWILDAANFACCLAYCMVSISFLVLRKKEPDMVRPYKVRNHKLVGVIAIIMSGIMAMMYVIPGTGCTLVWQEWIIVGGWTLLGVAFAIHSRHKYKELFATHVGE